MKKVLLIAGTRPNFIKLAPLYHKLKNYPKYNIKICHTGQHYDKNMSDVILNALKIPQPDFSLNVTGTNVADTIGKTIIEINNVIVKNPFDLLIVFGDVNATVAGAITGVQNKIKVAHVEAGLRSFDRNMPEEINRIITDHVSDLLFVSEESGMDNLKKEGFDMAKVHFVGNIMIESLLNTKHKWEKINFSKEINQFLELKPVVATFHRPENVDNKINLEKVLLILKEISINKKIIFPIHPRTKAKIKEFQLEDFFSNKNILFIEPQGYFEFINLISKSQLVITDSGGVQEETSFLNIPCVTFRKNTERPITIKIGTNLLLCIDDNDFKSKINMHIEEMNEREQVQIPLWDNKVSERIINIINQAN